MTKAFSYLRTSSDDGKDKMGLPVQRKAVEALAAQRGFEIAQEFADDGITGKLPMHARPQGKLLIAALLADGVKHVIVYDAKRVGRTQPAFWSFAGLCRDNGIALLAADGTDLLGSVMGGVNAMLSEMDRDATVARLAAGKALAKAAGKRTDGRYAFGAHPAVEFVGERAIVERIRKMHADGVTLYGIAKQLTAEGLRTRTGAEFKPQTITNILQRVVSASPTQAETLATGHR
jgi:DNA invertase Pin-like site-specific DNA recombinase